MKRILSSILILLITCQAFAITESGSVDAQSTVLYGKTSGGVLVPIKVDGTGAVDTSGSSSGGGFDSGNVTYVGCADSIATAVSAATAGDTLVLGSCTYNITADIDIDKSLNIVGQGISATVINMNTTSPINGIDISASSVWISNLSVTDTASTSGSSDGINVDGTAGNILTDIRITNVRVYMNSNNTKRGIDGIDAIGVINNVIVDVTSGTAAAIGVEWTAASSAEAAIDLKLLNSRIMTSAAASLGHGLNTSEGTTGVNHTFSVYHSTILATESAAGATTYGIEFGGVEMLGTIYYSTVAGTDRDFSNAARGTFVGSTANNGLVNGVPVYVGTLLNKAVDTQALIVKDGTIAADDTTPDVANRTFLKTSANTGPTAITDLDNPESGQIVCLIGGSATNSSTITDGGNFNLTSDMTLGLDDMICLYVDSDNDYVEISRSNN